jgi:hypothetical protein
VNATQPATLAATLIRERERAYLFRTLATLRRDILLFDDVESLRWKGPRKTFAALAKKLDAAQERG